MLKAKSNAKKQDLGLTISRATRDARRVVDRVMPGVNATVESRFGHDLDTDTPTVITEVTFPDGDLRRVELGMELRALSDASARVERARVVVTRKRNPTVQDWSTVRIGN